MTAETVFFKLAGHMLQTFDDLCEVTLEEKVAEAVERKRQERGGISNTNR